MIDIDGSAHSGSGTIVRHAAAYAALTGQPVRVRNARARRHHRPARQRELIVEGTREGLDAARPAAAPAAASPS